jgi:hypothetical protein
VGFVAFPGAARSPLGVREPCLPFPATRYLPSKSSPRQQPFLHRCILLPSCRFRPSSGLQLARLPERPPFRRRVARVGNLPMTEATGLPLGAHGAEAPCVRRPKPTPPDCRSNRVRGGTSPVHRSVRATRRGRSSCGRFRRGWASSTEVARGSLDRKRAPAVFQPRRARHRPPKWWVEPEDRFLGLLDAPIRRSGPPHPRGGPGKRRCGAFQPKLNGPYPPTRRSSWRLPRCPLPGSAVSCPPGERPTSRPCSADESVATSRRCRRGIARVSHGLVSPSRSSRFRCRPPRISAPKCRVTRWSKPPSRSSKASPGQPPCASRLTVGSSVSSSPRVVRGAPRHPFEGCS